jgi:hypothetical protein
LITNAMVREAKPIRPLLRLRLHESQMRIKRSK